jgi:rhodanese-related sulfurtransferase
LKLEAFDMRKLVTISAIALAGFFASSPFAQSPKQQERLKTIDEVVQDAHEGVTFIRSDELKTRIKANRKLVLLDVRTAAEYEAAHLKGAAWVERGVAEFVLVRQLPEPDAEIVVYCKVGNRTGLAVKALKKAGYRNVVGLDGGFDEWVKQRNTVHNYLGEFKMIEPIRRNASSPAIDFYEDKN